MRSKKVINNIISSVALQIVTIICGFIIPKLIIQKFGSNVNGLVVSITQFLAYIVLLESGVGPVVKSILYKPIANKDENQIKKILKASEKFFRRIAYIFIAYIGILCVILPLIMSDKFDSMFTISLILIISISTFAEYFFGMTYKLYLQAKQKAYVISVIQIVTLIINTIVVILLIQFGANIQVVKIVSALIFILRPILQNLYVKKKYNIYLKDVDNDYKIDQKWDGLIQHIAFVIHKNVDVVILSFFGMIKEVSVYSIYLLIINSVKNVVQSAIGGVDASFGDMIANNEHENLNKNFKIYEGFYLTLTTIIFSATFFLIIPFVKLYTNGITDADYINSTFAYIMLLAELLWTIRQPYNDLIKTAGHFKQTRKGAIIEVISNIIISVILVWNFGLIGVAIGTLVAMLIRTIELIIYSSKNILKRSIWYAFKRLILLFAEFAIIVLIIHIIPKIEIENYANWTIQAIVVVVISIAVVVSLNSLFFKNNLKNIINVLKNMLNKK